MHNRGWSKFGFKRGLPVYKNEIPCFFTSTTARQSSKTVNKAASRWNDSSGMIYVVVARFLKQQKTLP